MIGWVILAASVVGMLAIASFWIYLKYRKPKYEILPRTRAILETTYYTRHKGNGVLPSVNDLDRALLCFLDLVYGYFKRTKDPLCLARVMVIPIPGKPAKRVDGKLVFSNDGSGCYYEDPFDMPKHRTHCLYAGRRFGSLIKLAWCEKTNLKNSLLYHEVTHYWLETVMGNADDRHDRWPELWSKVEEWQRKYA